MEKKEPPFHRKRLWVKIVWQSATILMLGILSGIIYNHVRQQPLSLLPTQAANGSSNLHGADGLVISLDDARELFFSHSAVFLDARPREFYELGHIAGARSLPYDEFDKLFPSVMKNVGTETIIVAYCDGEHCNLSKDLALALIHKGYSNVYVLPNGWTSWKEAGLPIEPSGEQQGG